MKKIVAFVLVLIFSISLLTACFAGNPIADGFTNGAAFGICPKCHRFCKIDYGEWTKTYLDYPKYQRTIHYLCPTIHCIWDYQ